MLTISTAATLEQLVTVSDERPRLLLARMSVGLDYAQAAQARKIFQVQRSIGEGETLKLLAVIFKAFVDSVRVPHKPDAADLIELAETVMRKYSHDSLKDIILALKEARTSGRNFFQEIDQGKIFAVLNEYFDKKAAFLESRHQDQKAQGASAQSQAVALLDNLAPKLVEQLADRIPDDHPNHDVLRARLSLQKQRQRRGLPSPDPEEFRRQQHAAAFRNARTDWQARPDAPLGETGKYVRQLRAENEQQRLRNSA
ncbi:hypothetical protein [Hymenobacter mucosus]|uniref:Uncharacterized protein n=1 Tax=Hymenobacter mucosus TaxID=1411120 RepID=A0A238X2Q4_9BACT|nr:hypothetical protein [Hymenobacter mucosus]SNR52863.1 hypothetical protein SAMN06269173_103395 [Hymenobacter mucosus]